jgi:LmbE family N-acetylglucosaminyl deacetylase
LTPFARTLHQEWGDPPNPMAHRRAEDTQALAVLGCASQMWSYRDAIYRHPAYDSEDAIFGRLADEATLEEELCDRCATLPASLWLFPLAVGRHVDHQLLFRVGWQLYEAGRSVAFYEDVPYVAWAGSPAGRLAALGRPLWPHRTEITPYWSTKIAAISCYPSQLAVLTYRGVPLLEAVAHYAAALTVSGYTERLWRGRAAPLIL